MMNRPTIGWVVAMAIGVSGTAIADSAKTPKQTQQRTTTTTTTTVISQQRPQQQSTSEKRTLEQQTRDTAVGAPRSPERQVADVPVPGTGEEIGFAIEERPAAAMPLEDRVEAIRLKALEKEEAVHVQTSLQELGYYTGKVDGVVGPMTRAALQRYFRDQAALAARGLVGSAALISLGIDESVIQRVRGLEEDPSDQHGPGTKEPGTR